MAKEITAAFRTVMLFISLSWLSVMYLLVYRVPNLNDDNIDRGYRITEDNVDTENYRIKTYLRDDSAFQIFGSKDPSRLQQDWANPNTDLRFRSSQVDKRGALNVPPRKLNPDKTADRIRKLNRNNTKISGHFDCRLLERMNNHEVLGMGYTKVVRRVVIDGNEFAVKYTTSHNHDIVKCKSERPLDRHFECFNLAKFKLLKEALLLSQLKHRNILKVYGVCPWKANDVEGTESVMTVITEVGKPLDVIKILQIPWDQRLKISLDLTDLLIYLDNTHIGSLLIKDFRIEQLVLKDGTLKLTDLDDIDGRLKACKTHHDCVVGSSRVNTTLPCKYQRCQNYSRTVNLYNFYKIFLDYSLNFDNPSYVGDDLKALAKRIATFNIGLAGLWRELNRVAWNIKAGVYAREFIKTARNIAQLNAFEEFTGAAIMGDNFDYYCIGSRSLTSCEMVVFNTEVAKIMCSLSSECKAIVFKPERNWLGQIVVVFKNSGRSLTPVTEHTTYVKIE